MQVNTRDSTQELVSLANKVTIFLVIINYILSSVNLLFLPDIENIYMSEKKSNHVKEKYDI